MQENTTFVTFFALVWLQLKVGLRTIQLLSGLPNSIFVFKWKPTTNVQMYFTLSLLP